MMSVPQRVKYVLYCLWIVLLHCIGYSPLSPLAIGGAYPYLSLIPVIFIAVHEGNFIGSIFGVITGLLVDVNATDGEGFNALIYLIAGFFCGYFCEYVLQKNTLGAVILSFVTPCFVAFAKWANSGSGFYFPLFTSFYLKNAICTFAFALLLYGIFKVTTGNRNKKISFLGVYGNGKNAWTPAPIKKRTRQKTAV